MSILSETPSITYHCVDKAGNFRSNTVPGPNAVTWGVFPGAEVIQPTVVDSTAFQAWKDEAYELGHQWALLYSQTAPESNKVIREIFDDFHLGTSAETLSPPLTRMRWHSREANRELLPPIPFSQYRLQRFQGPERGRRV